MKKKTFKTDISQYKTQIRTRLRNMVYITKYHFLVNPLNGIGDSGIALNPKYTFDWPVEKILEGPPKGKFRER